VKAVIYAKLQYSTSRQIVPSFASSISGGLHMWRRLVTKEGTTKSLPRLQRVISITFPDWAFLHPEQA